MEHPEPQQPDAEQLSAASQSSEADGAGTDGNGASERSELRSAGEPTSVDKGGQDLQALEGEIVDQVTGRLVELLSASSSSMSSWTGPMPSPQDLREYQQLIPDAPERMLQIHESQTLGAAARLDKHSARQDKLVDAEIAEAKAGRTAAVSLMILCMIPSIVFFALGNNIAGCAFLSLPVLGFLKSLLPNRNADNSRE